MRYRSPLPNLKEKCQHEFWRLSKMTSFWGTFYICSWNVTRQVYWKKWGIVSHQIAAFFPTMKSKARSKIHQTLSIVKNYGFLMDRLLKLRSDFQIFNNRAHPLENSCVRQSLSLLSSRTLDNQPIKRMVLVFSLSSDETIRDWSKQLNAFSYFHSDWRCRESKQWQSSFQPWIRWIGRLSQVKLSFASWS